MSGHWKWQARVCLYQLGLWPFIERARLATSFLLRKPHEEDFRLFSTLHSKKDGLFLDIGANLGQSAISFSIFNRNYRIISFEPNPAHEGDLRFVKLLLGPRFEYRLIGLAEKSFDASLFIPFVDSVPLTQEATLDPHELTDNKLTVSRIMNFTGSENWDVKSFPFHLNALDELKLEPDLIKLDVQGAEVQVLKGMAKTLKRNQPLLLLENTLSFAEIDQFLAGFSYHPYSYNASLNKLEPLFQRSPRLNTFYLPEQEALKIRERGLIDS